MKATIEEITANGDRQTATYTAKYDGNDYPYSGNPNIDTISLKRIDSRTVELTGKKGGKTVPGTNRIVISEDGKTMIQTGKYINARGVLVNNVVVYNKQ